MKTYKSKSYLILLVSFIFFLSGCKEKTIEKILYENEEGSITGIIKPTEEILKNYPIGYFNVSLDLYGKTLTILDNNGKFTIQNVSEGVYTLYIRIGNYNAIKKVENIKIEPHQKVDLGEITISSYDGNNTNNSDFNVSVNYSFIPESNSFNNYYNLYYLPNTNTITSLTDSINLNGFFYRGYNSNGNYKIMDSSVTMYYNGVISYHHTNRKGNLNLKVKLLKGNNRIAFWPGNTDTVSTPPRVYSIYKKSRNNNVQISLYWSTANGTIGAGDADLYLVNLTTNDTCYFGNSNPDWGIIGRTIDNPRLSDNQNSANYYSSTEYLQIDETPAGKYKILVNYFSNPNSLKQINVDAQLVINNQNTYYKLTNLNVGDWKEVTTFTISE